MAPHPKMKPPDPTAPKTNPSLAEVTDDPVSKTCEMDAPVGNARLESVTVCVA